MEDKNQFCCLNPMPRLFLTVSILCYLTVGILKAQTDSNRLVQAKKTQLDSVYTINDRIDDVARRDSLKKIADSLSYFWVKIPDAKRPNQFRDSLITVYQIKNLDFESWASKYIPQKNTELSGKRRAHGSQWIVYTVLLLWLVFAILRFKFTKELQSVIQSFFDHRFLGQSASLGSMLNTWPFLFFYLLFGFTIGMYLFLVGKYLQLSYGWSDSSWYLILSVVVMALFVFKIFALQFLGFILEVKKAVNTYISILFLSYFQAALVFLPLILAFSLSPSSYAVCFLYAGIGLTLLLLSHQLVRAFVHIISHFQFPKFYIFVYLCALEICPILILIKALRF